ncbi:MAG: aminotransferase class I/II-fold pyridoxal phosphate-dependent enzyme [Chloroflexaceae bacterium]
MLDFTSALYLGLHHASADLRPWARLTTGRPAALADPPGAAALARRLAELQGCQQAVLAPSTLHLFWDFCGTFDPRDTAVFLDRGAYAVARWGAERAAARGVRVRVFPHHDTAALIRLIAAEPRTPLVISDGFCPACGQPAPLRGYLMAARERGGRLLIDDSQALGILGAAPGPDAPYGHGGGGTPAYLGLDAPDLLRFCSLAKGFGAPLAVMGGDHATIEAFCAHSATRVHCSPPAQAAIAAAARALDLNARAGDMLRLRLWHLVQRFRQRLRAMGLQAEGGGFPVQTLAPLPGIAPRALHRTLARLGLRTILRRTPGGDPRISVIVTAQHTPAQIDRAATLVRLALATLQASGRTGGMYE